MKDINPDFGRRPFFVPSGIQSNVAHLELCGSTNFIRLNWRLRVLKIGSPSGFEERSNANS
jgi:hypothetical protein